MLPCCMSQTDQARLLRIDSVGSGEQTERTKRDEREAEGEDKMKDMNERHETSVSY